MNLNYKDFIKDCWFIKLWSPEEVWHPDCTPKAPMDEWDGYSTDFGNNPDVYDYRHVKNSSRKWWGIVGHKDIGKKNLLALDIDTYKFNEEDKKKVEEWLQNNEWANQQLIIKSWNGGYHIIFNYSGPKISGKETHPYVDVKGQAGGHVVAPLNDEYEVINDVYPQKVSRRDLAENTPRILWENKKRLREKIVHADGGLLSIEVYE